MKVKWKRCWTPGHFYAVSLAWSTNLFLFPSLFLLFVSEPDQLRCAPYSSRAGIWSVSVGFFGPFYFFFCLWQSLSQNGGFNSRYHLVYFTSRREIFQTRVNTQEGLPAPCPLFLGKSPWPGLVGCSQDMWGTEFLQRHFAKDIFFRTMAIDS